MLPVQGINVAAGIMAQTWKGYVTREEADHFLRRALDRGRLYPFVAYVGGHPAGSTLAVVRGRTAQLFGGVHVLPGYRRRGVGSALLRAAMRHLRTLGVSRLYVARQVSEPPTADDVAAMTLYDRAGGLRRKPLVEVVYSPQCPWAASWLRDLEEIVSAGEVDFRAYNLWEEPGKAWPLLNAASGRLATPGRRALTKNVFFRVFVDGEPAGEGVPLPPAELAHVLDAALGRDATVAAAGAGAVAGTLTPGAPAPGVTASGARYTEAPPRVGDFPRVLAGLEVVPLTVAGCASEFGMCLERHPSGLKVARRAAEEGAAQKRRWLEGLDLPDGFYGVAARRGDRVVGLLEVYPRPVAARAGFVTGTWGDGEDDRILTVACLEVAQGESRQPIMEFLLEGLLDELDARPRGFEHLEAFGKYGNMAGLNPYWLYDKYGFTRREETEPGVGAVLSRPIRRPETGEVGVKHEQ